MESPVPAVLSDEELVASRIEALRSQGLLSADLESRRGHIVFPSHPPASASLPSLIDHTILKPNATSAEIVNLCKEAAEHRFYSVCVNSSRVEDAKSALHSFGAASSVHIASVVGFPLGAASTVAKVAETKQAVLDGATELDMVLNIGKLLDGDYSFVKNDIQAVVEAAGSAKVKVILETGVYSANRPLIVDACLLCVEARAHFVKTSTGFGGYDGAKVEIVRLMKITVGEAAEVKASGGVRTRDAVLAMFAVGATRIGTSSGVSIAAAGEAAPGSY